MKLPEMCCISSASASILAFTILTWIRLKLAIFARVTWNKQNRNTNTMLYFHFIVKIFVQLLKTKLIKPYIKYNMNFAVEMSGWIHCFHLIYKHNYRVR